MIFNYYLGSFGWAGIIFEHGDFYRNYSVEEFLSDDLSELLEGMISLIYDESHEDEREKIINDIYCKCIENRHRNNDDSIFEWLLNVGPEQTKFIFTVQENSDKIHLKITEYTQYNDNTEQIEEVFNGELIFNELLDNLLSSCSFILNKYGIIGYYRNFWKEFPVSYYLILDNFRNKSINSENFEEIINNENSFMYKTNIVDEINILHKKEP